jgi:hypothetical protein
MIKSLLDECFFYLVAGGYFRGCAAIVVDDLLMGGGDKMNDIYDRLRARFCFGKWQPYKGMYRGNWVSQDPETLEVTITQEDQIKDNMRHIDIPTAVRKLGLEARVPPEIVDEGRSQVGSAPYYARETRPDAAGDASMLQCAWPYPTVQDIINVNKLTKKLLEHPCALVYKKLEDPTFLLATDAGWANDFDEETGEKINSRAGWVVVAVDGAVRDGAESHVNFLGWKSHRLDRVCNSTLMAESCSLADGLAELRVFQLLWAEATTGNPLEDLIGQPLPAIVTVDCKSVWDTCNN